MVQKTEDITLNFGLVHRFLLFTQCSELTERLKEGDKEFQSKEICRFFQEAEGTYTEADFDDFCALAETHLDLEYIIGWWDKNVGKRNDIVDGLRSSMARQKFHIVRNAATVSENAEEIGGKEC